MTLHFQHSPECGTAKTTDSLRFRTGTLDGAIADAERRLTTEDQAQRRRANDACMSQIAEIQTANRKAWRR